MKKNCDFNKVVYQRLHAKDFAQKAQSTHHLLVLAIGAIVVAVAGMGV